MSFSEANVVAVSICIRTCDALTCCCAKSFDWHVVLIDHLSCPPASLEFVGANKKTPFLIGLGFETHFRFANMCAVASVDVKTVGYLSKLNASQTFLLQLDGFTQYQWLEKLLSLKTLVDVPEDVIREIVKRARADDGNEGLEMLRFELVKIIPDVKMHLMADRLMYTASKAHSKRNDNVVQYLHFLDQDIRNALWPNADEQLPFFKWMQFSFCASSLQDGRANDLELRMVTNGLTNSELKYLADRYEQRGALSWFYSLTTSIQVLLTHHFVHTRGGKY